MLDSCEHFNVRRRHEERQCRVTSTFTVAKSAQNVRRLDVVGKGQSLEEAVERFVIAKRNPAWQQVLDSPAVHHQTRAMHLADQRK
jgi:hypothetical protein